jgi:hypothetical protein
MDMLLNYRVWGSPLLSLGFSVSWLLSWFPGSKRFSNGFSSTVIVFHNKTRPALHYLYCRTTAIRILSIGAIYKFFVYFHLDCKHVIRNNLQILIYDKLASTQLYHIHEA